MDEARHQSPAGQDYLTAMHTLQREREQAVSTTELADQLGVTPASASHMVKRLAERELVTHVPYHGARLTEAGERVARRTVRRRRLLTTFLASELGMARDQAERHAAMLEHGLSAEVEALIAARIGEAEHAEEAAHVTAS